MARIVLSEANNGVRNLLEEVVFRRGHEALPLNGRRDSELPACDLLIAEPAYGEGLRDALAFRRRDGSLPIVFVSILPPERAFLALSPCAYLVKPFSISALEKALDEALAGSRAGV